MRRRVSLRTRTVVAAVAVFLLAATAGCSGLVGGGDATTGPLFVNQDDAEHAVVVQVTTGEYRVTVTVAANATVLTHTFSGGSNLTIGIDDQGDVSPGP